MSAHLRIARPVRNLARSVAMYRQGLALDELGSFSDHQGFDGAMLGNPGTQFHLEFTFCRNHPVQPCPTEEDLLVFYVPESGAWARRCAALLAAGFQEVESFNPYWSASGRTFKDPDGYRLVVQCASWSDERGA